MPVDYYKTYTDAAAEAQRQQRLAELLQQQAQEPTQQYSYQGIQAMPSLAGGLAKILSAYGARKASDKAMEAQRQAGERLDQTGAGIAGRLIGGFTPDAGLVKKTDMGYEATPQQVPEQTSLEEVTRTSQYKQSPQDALRMAMTPTGAAAMQRSPMLAQLLAKTMQTPDQTKIYGDIDPSKYTSESNKAFAQSVAAGRPDYSVLVPIEKPSKAPTTVGGMMWNEKTGKFEAIPGYTSQAAAVAAAGRAPEAPVAVMGPNGKAMYVSRERAMGMTPYTGATLKQEQTEAAAAQTKRNSEVSTQKALDDAAALYIHPGREAGTGGTSWMANIPGTQARDFNARLNTFKAETFVPMVSALKGMGALSDAEGKKLTESVGSLDPGMSEQEFAKSLYETTQFLYNKAKAAGLNVQMPNFPNAAQSKGQSSIRSQADAIIGGKQP